MNDTGLTLVLVRYRGAEFECEIPEPLRVWDFFGSLA